MGTLGSRPAKESFSFQLSLVPCLGIGTSVPILRRAVGHLSCAGPWPFAKWSTTICLCGSIVPNPFALPCLPLHVSTAVSATMGLSSSHASAHRHMMDHRCLFALSLLRRSSAPFVQPPSLWPCAPISLQGRPSAHSPFRLPPQGRIRHEEMSSRITFSKETPSHPQGTADKLIERTCSEV
jgi:hypothetical protein